MSGASRDMANRLLADHIELAGIGEAGVAAGSELETVQDLWIDEIADAIHRRIRRAAGITNMAVSGDLDHVKVDIHARRPGVALGHGGAEFDRLRTELEELTGKPVQLEHTGGPPGEGAEGNTSRALGDALAVPQGCSSMPCAAGYRGWWCAAR